LSLPDEVEDGLIDIASAVQALEATAFCTRFDLDFLDPVEDQLKRSRLTWGGILPVIQRDLPSYSMSRECYENIWDAVQKEAPSHLKEAFEAALEAWRLNAWPGFQRTLVSETAEGFGDHSLTEERLREHLRKWPALRVEKSVIKAGLLKLRSSGSTLKEAVRNLLELNGDREDATVALATITSMHHFGHEGLITELLSAWVGNSVWGQLMTALWADVPEAHALPTNVVDVAYMLRQMPLVTGSPLDGFVIGDMAGASRAAWRRSLRERIGEDVELRAAVTEAMLWFASPNEDLFAQFAALEINEPEPAAAITPYLAHGSRRVGLRARSALDLLSKAADPIESLLTQDRPDNSDEITVRPSRTWLGDARLEQMLRLAFSKATSSMAKEVPLTASSGEENLVGKLLERLRGVCEQVTRDAAVLARETDRGERLTVSLSHRVIGKSEEGKEGLAKGHRFSTDVTMIVRARRGAAPPFSQRATFIQAKRMRRGGSPESVHYAVDMNQMNDIAKHTSSSFLLAVGPELTGITMPIVPAQLMIDRFGTDVRERHIHPDMVSRLGRSLADWLVDDVIGLWTGDPRLDALSKAASGSGDGDSLIVEVDVAMVPIVPDFEKTGR
jgi:hypothetical protein